MTLKTKREIVKRFMSGLCINHIRVRVSGIDPREKIEPVLRDFMIGKLALSPSTKRKMDMKS